MQEDRAAGPASAGAAHRDGAGGGGSGFCGAVHHDRAEEEVRGRMGSTPVSGSGLALAAVLTVSVLGLAGCSDSLPSMPKLNDLNPFAEKQQPLPGLA